MASQCSNAFLNALPQALTAELLDLAKLVELPFGTSIFSADEKPRHVHFLESGLASIITVFRDGTGVETGLTGNESFPEKIHLLGQSLHNCNCFMQVTGSAYQIRFDLFQSWVAESVDIKRLLMQHSQAEWMTLQQLSACNRVHLIEERLARWLLTVADHVGPELYLTQDVLAYMLGCRRSSVTTAAGKLQHAGLISYRRGQIKIKDRPLLLGAACECYAICCGYREAMSAGFSSHGRIRKGDSA